MEILKHDVIAQVFAQGLSQKFEKAGIAPVSVVNFVSPLLKMAAAPFVNDYQYHPDGEAPRDGEVFVFGSNLSGVHGAGAARAALDLYGAIVGVGQGEMGNSYALPTKNQQIESMSLEEISRFVAEFKTHAMYSKKTFFMTRVGCGLAGYTDEQIGPMFVGSPTNIIFPIEWAQYISVKDAACRA